MCSQNGWVVFVYTNLSVVFFSLNVFLKELIMCRLSFRAVHPKPRVPLP